MGPPMTDTNIAHKNEENPKKKMEWNDFENDSFKFIILYRKALFKWIPFWCEKYSTFNNLKFYSHYNWLQYADE